MSTWSSRPASAPALSHELALPAGEAELAAVPNVAGVFLVWPPEGAPYVGRTNVLRQRLARLLRPGERQSRRLNLAQAARAEYQPTGSPFEAALLVWRLARKFRREDYQRFLKLRPPPLLKVNLTNPYPRCYITRRLSHDQALYFGPFTSRAAAERFQNAFLDLFLMRRCREEIVPDPAHPGCIYGEMRMCLRPCQAASTREEYAAETGRVVEFLATRGESLVKLLGAEREQASAQLEFERAARLHRRLEKTLDALKVNEEIARDLDHLDGVVIQRSIEPAAVEMWFLRQGFLQPRQRFPLAAEDGRPVSLDQKLRETIAALGLRRRAPRERAEQLALLVRWHASSWRRGELVLFDDWDRVPYRKLIRAISRVAGEGEAAGALDAAPAAR